MLCFAPRLSKMQEMGVYDLVIKHMGGDENTNGMGDHR